MTLISFRKLTSCSNVCANKPYSDLVLKNQKKVAVASILSKNFRRYGPPFFQRGCKGKSLYLFDQLFLTKSEEKFDARIVCKNSLFLSDGKCTP